MDRANKLDLIKAAQPLLVVNSRFKNDKKMSLHVVWGIFIVSFASFLALVLWKITDPLLIILDILVFVVLLIAVKVLSLNIINRGSSLVITSEGIIMLPYLVERWEDLDGYRFVDYTKLENLSLSSSGIGVTLLLHNKGLAQPSITLNGHSIIALNGIFFGRN